MTKRRFLFSTISIYLLFYMGDCFVSSYYALFFIEKGMTPSQQSLLLAFIPLSLFLGCFAMSFLAKTKTVSLWLFRLCAVLETVLVFCFAFCITFSTLLVFSILIAFFNGAPFTFLEGYVQPTGEQYGISYSKIRLFGTIGYIVALVIGFFVLGSFPIKNCLFISSGLFLVSIGAAMLLKTPAEEGDLLSGQENTGKMPLFTRTFVMFLLFSVFYYGVLNSVFYIIPIALKSYGGSDAEYSLMRGIGVGAELVVLLFLSFVIRKRTKARPMLVLAVILAIAATAFGIFSTNPYVLGYGFFIISGASKALLFAHESVFLSAAVGKNNLGKALTLNMGANNLTTTVLNYLSDLLYQNIGFAGYFGLICGLEVVSLVFLLFCRDKNGSPEVQTA